MYWELALRNQDGELVQYWEGGLDDRKKNQGVLLGSVWFPVNEGREQGDAQQDCCRAGHTGGRT